MLSDQVKVDRRGRLVIPLRVRERLGVARGGILQLTETPDGLLLDHRPTATVRIADDGLPLIVSEGMERFSNDESLNAIYRERERS